MDTMRELIAAELRATLARHRVSAAALARQLGWSQSYIARRVDGRAEPTMTELQAIAEALDVPLVELLPRQVLRKRDGSIAQTIRRPERPRRAAVRTMVPATAERLTARVPTTQPETSQRATRLAVA